MANFTITKGTTLPDSANKTDFYNLVDNATGVLDNLVNADISASAAIASTKINFASGIASASITSSTLTTTTLAGVTTFDENASLQLDSALSADGKYCGITEAGTLGETVAFGGLVYLKAADSKWWKTDADADATSGAVKIGICVVGGDADDATTILLYGKVRADSLFPTFTISAPVYVSTTAGEVQVAQPSGTDDVIRIVGYGNTADELFFCPSNDYITHA